jgi:pSer/pThr/pTyr-binding forkhead associated (FHA) protein/tetratricopeptide (TPR) repeat protein
MPPNPKRPHSGEPITDEQILHADDPRPQRVAQLPSNTAGARRLKKIEEHIPTSVFDTEADQEMQAEYGVQGTEHKPAFLYVERGPGAGQLLEVKQGTVVVGRASVSDLRLQHPSISRRHTQIKRVGEQFFVKDLGSQNGTFVNKQRIATEVEVKPGDSIALGNALLRLRGPLAKGEKLPGQSTQQPKHVPPPPPSVEIPTPPSGTGERSSTKSRISTAVVARPSGPQSGPTTTALRIAVFAGAVGFSLAAVLAFALVKTMSSDKPSPTTVAKKGSSADSDADKSDRAKLIDEAIKRKMAEKPAAKAAPKEEPAAEEEPVIESDDSVNVKEQPKAPVVAKAPVVTPVAPKAAPAPVRKASAAAKDEDEDEDAAPAKGAGGGKRATILAPYEKGNAEASLDLAKKAGDKDLSDKLSRFIAAYDAANDAMMSNNGNAAIANFQKALSLDEQLSSGWGKYGAEIRRQLANLYVLVGLAFVNNGDTEKAKTAFQGALKHDPNNARAKAQLAKLTGGEAKPKSADDAFDEEPATPKKPAKKAPPKSSIDDAFGD